MDWNLFFFINCILLGVGLAMDAFSVSIANCLANPKMGRAGMTGMALSYGLFQFIMPMAGWLCVHTIITIFEKFQPFIPWIAFILLLYIGGKMVIEGLRGEVEEGKRLTFGVLMIQSVATSIDALSVGFTIAEYNAAMALVASLIIATVTFAICLGGAAIGKKLGTILAWKASILGGFILIAIGLEILAGSLFP
ncbi:MAG: manganese efflux pump [Spirochaetia bacterium]|nr:manganese efflux pump [Spirochaetia bacterium]MBQ3647350.1 manganese efflux pump [Spirochaetia bacterium]